MPEAAWESPIPETTIDGVSIRPLNSTQALAEEGRYMRHRAAHCVPHCLKGYRIFSLTEQADAIDPSPPTRAMKTTK